VVFRAYSWKRSRSKRIGPARLHLLKCNKMLGLRSRWETESFLKRAEAFHDYTTDDLERDIAAIRDASRQ
jgi:hypothetical protein